MRIPRVSMIYSKIYMIRFDNLLCKILYTSKCKRWILLIFTTFDIMISNIKYTECQRNQNKFNRIYYPCWSTILDDKRKTLALKIMVRRVIKICLISSKFWEYDIRYVLTKIGKQQKIPSITFRAMINLRGKVPNRVVFNKKCP